jgi:hypothetical protein
MTAKNVMMQCASFAQGHADQSPLCSLCRFSNSFRHFTRLTVTKANAAFLIADNNECGKTKPTSALHNFRDAIDVNQTVHKFAIALFSVATATTFTFTRHFLFRHLRDAPGAARFDKLSDFSI